MTGRPGAPTLLLPLGALLAGACGGGGSGGGKPPDPFCGDRKMDTGEQCDDGNNVSGDGCSDRCRDERYGDLLVQWEFNTDKKGMDNPPVFGSDSCTDFVPPASGATTMRLRATPDPTVLDVTKGCPEGQISKAMIPVGTYKLELVMLWDDGAGPKEISAVKTLDVTITGGLQTLPPRVVFTSADFTPAPEGWLFFKTQFGSQTGPSCAMATPPVTQQRLTLKPKAGGGAVTQRTATMVPLDGSAPGPCLPGSSPDPQRVENLKSDFYLFRVEGLDAAGAVVYCGVSTLFVGAGRFNDTYNLVIPAATTCPAF